MSKYDVNKLTKLQALKDLAEKIQSDYATKKEVEDLSDKIEDIVSTGGEPNTLEGVSVNGTALKIADKIVDILIATGTDEGTIKVNNVDIAVAGLAALAFKAKVSESDLEEALKTSINNKADSATLNILQSAFNTLKGDAEGSVKDVVNKAINDFANETSNDNKVNTIKELVDWVAEHGPEAATMSANISKNAEDVTALKTLIGTIPKTATSTDIVNYIAEEIKKLAIGEYVKTEDLTTTLNEYVKKSGTKQLSDENFTTAEKAKLAGIEIASDEEVEAMLDEVFTEE